LKKQSGIEVRVDARSTRLMRTYRTAKKTGRLDATTSREAYDRVPSQRVWGRLITDLLQKTPTAIDRLQNWSNYGCRFSRPHDEL